MSHRSEEGIALIAVLWVLTLLSLIAAALIVEIRSSTRVARNMVDNAASRVAADAGIQRAILALAAPPDTRKLHADGRIYEWRFATSKVRISAQDELAKANLNTASVARLARLFDSVGIDPNTAQALADAIADFRDVDHFKHPNGAEEADYRAAGLSWGPKNLPFEGVEELRQVLGMTERIFERVAHAGGATREAPMTSRRSGDQNT